MGKNFFLEKIYRYSLPCENFFVLCVAKKTA